MVFKVCEISLNCYNSFSMLKRTLLLIYIKRTVFFPCKKGFFGLFRLICYNRKVSAFHRGVRAFLCCLGWVWASKRVRVGWGWVVHGWGRVSMERFWAGGVGRGMVGVGSVGVAMVGPWSGMGWFCPWGC